MRLRSALPLGTAAALLSAVLALPGQAEAQAASTPSGPPVITVATPGLPFAGDASGGTDRKLSVIAWDVPTQGGEDIGAVTSVTLHLRLQGSPAGAPDDLVVPGLSRYYAGSATWVTNSPVTMPRLGIYDITAEVTDAGGHTALIPDVGTYTDAAVVTVTSLAASPRTVDYEHRTVTVSGHLTITDPDTGGTLAPDQLSLFVSSNALIEGGYAVPDGNGDFTTTVTVDSGPTLSFTGGPVRGTGSTPYRLQSSVTSNTVSITQEKTRIRLLEPQQYYVKSDPVTLSGIVERQVGKSWLPAPDLAVTYQVDGQYTVFSGHDGVFHATVPYFGSYQFTTGGDVDRFGRSGVYLAGSTSPAVYVHIPITTRFSWLSWNENPYGEADISATLSAEGGPGIPDNKFDVAVQYSPDGKSWHFVGWTRLGRPGAGSNTVHFYATYKGAANGYWRLYFPGTPDLAPALSPSMHMSMTSTRITGGTPSTRHPYRGQYLRFSGTLQQYRSGAWLPFGSVQVQLLFRPTGSKTWYEMSTARTDRDGRYRIGAHDPRSGTWAVTYLVSDGTHLYAIGPQTWVRAG